MSGPLSGVRIVEIAGIGPAPFCAMMLADMGAEVVRVDRIDAPPLPGIEASLDVLNRGRRSVAVDLKAAAGRDLVLELVEQADALIEGFRPGVAERLGIGPDACQARNSRLVYGRMTGYGQTGPLAQEAGHDLNYLALSGVLSMIGRKDEAPVPPLNLVADFGGGGMLLALGVLAALLQVRSSGKGQVVDAAMVDGASLLAAWFSGARAMGLWQDTRGANLLDSGAPFYDVYQCSDGEYLSVAAIEPQFFANLLAALGLEASALPHQLDRESWPRLREALAERFATKTRDAWCAIFDGADACVAPVLSPTEAVHHPHNQARGTFVKAFGVTQPAPAPRFSETAGSIAGPPPSPGEHSDDVLRAWGVSADRIASLRSGGAIG